jgi:hypothetical protein
MRRGLGSPRRRWGIIPSTSVGRSSSCRRRGRELNEVDLGIHPTVEAVHEAVRAKGGSLSCPICGRDEFALEEVTVLGAGMAEGYGTRRVQRGQLVCENCGCVVSIDLTRLGAGAAAGGAAAGGASAGPVSGVTDTVGGVTGSVSGVTDKLFGGGGEKEKRR